LSAMSRSMPRTASVSSKRLITLRSDTCAMLLTPQPLVAPAVRPAM
jgi:hypothetical protein